MKKWSYLRSAVAFVLIAFLMCGCMGNGKPDPALDPKLHIEHYNKLTALYGTERLETLEKLGYKIEDTNVVHGFYIGIPLQAEIAGVVFDIYLSFDNEAKLSNVVYEKKYSYPSEADQAVQDALTIGQLLEENLGKPAQTDGWNDWLEEEYDTEMDPDPPTYISESELRKLIDNSTGGGIMWWDMTDYICATAKEYRVMRFGDEAVCGFGLGFSADIEYGSEIVLTINF